MCYHESPFERTAGATGSLALAIAQGKYTYPTASADNTGNDDLDDPPLDPYSEKVYVFVLQVCVLGTSPLL